MACIPEASDIVKWPPWIVAQCLHILLSLATIILSVKFVIKLKRSSLFNSSTVSLLLLFTAFANVHAVILTGMKVHELINNILHSDACELTWKTSECAILTYLVLSCVIGMIICHNILWVDRLIATTLPEFHHSYCKALATCLSMTTTTIAFLLPFLLLRNDPYDDLVLTCLVLPAGSAPQVNRLFHCFIVLGLISIVANFCLYLINRRKRKTHRFNVRQRFYAYENQLVAKWVGIVVSVQFIILTTYALSMYLIRTQGQMLPLLTREMLRMWFYIVPLATVFLPLISLLILRQSTVNRHLSINRLRSEKNDTIVRMEQLMRMWS